MKYTYTPIVLSLFIITGLQGGIGPFLERSTPPPPETTLTVETEVPILMDGQRVGEMDAAVGTKARVISLDQEKVLIEVFGNRVEVPVSHTTIEQDYPAWEKQWLADRNARIEQQEQAARAAEQERLEKSLQAEWESLDRRRVRGSITYVATIRGNQRAYALYSREPTVIIPRASGLGRVGGGGHVPSGPPPEEPRVPFVRGEALVLGLDVSTTTIGQGLSEVVVADGVAQSIVIDGILIEKPLPVYITFDLWKQRRLEAPQE